MYIINQRSIQRHRINFPGKAQRGNPKQYEGGGFSLAWCKKIMVRQKHRRENGACSKLSADSTPGTVAAASAAAEPVSKFGIKAGDILADSWGYSMTIVEFYKVTKIISATKIEIVELGHILTDSDRGGGEYVLPDTEHYIGEPIVKQVAQNSYEKQDGRWHVKINSSVSLTPWSGRPLYQNTWD